MLQHMAQRAAHRDGAVAHKTPQGWRPSPAAPGSAAKSFEAMRGSEPRPDLAMV